MTTKIKKGTEVWLFGNYDGKASVHALRLTIMSWGAKQGTAIRVENGRNIETRLYVERVADQIVPVSVMPDPTAEGMRRAVEQKAKGVAHYVERAHHYCSDLASDGYHEHMKQKCEELLASEPNFIIS
jgi:hypothetical protein